MTTLQKNNRRDQRRIKDWQEKARDWLACARRDLFIVVKGVWKNVVAYLGMLAVAAVILDLCQWFREAGFLQLLLDSFHLSHFMRVPEAEKAAASSILAFLLPIFTIIIVGEGALRVAVVYLQRRQRWEEWEPMVIGTFSEYTIVCGVGELGRSICERLLQKEPQAQCRISKKESLWRPIKRSWWLGM